MHRILLKNAKIYTSDDVLGVIESGYICVENKKIVAVGKMKEFSANDDSGDTEVIDLSGKLVYPGFVDAHTHIGICESGLSFEGDDTNEFTEPILPQLRSLDAVNPFDTAFKEALSAGVTTVVISPGSANPIGGEIFAMKTHGYSVDDMILRENIGIKFALGENPKSTYSERDETPVTRMAAVALIREALYKAKRYYEDIEKSDSLDDATLPDFDIKCEALMPLIKGETKAFFHAHRPDDICTAMRLAKEFDLNYVIVHATGAQSIKEYLSKEKANVLIGPILSDKCKPELSLHSCKTAGILAKDKNITVCVVTDHPETPIQYLLLSCKVAVECGMSEEEALKAITISPSKICNIDDKVGSIKPGKDADILIFSRDPFKSMCLSPDAVMVSGEIFSNAI